ncbi:hypothetical protein NN561_011312 [Cricetulus griseus]
MLIGYSPCRSAPRTLPRVPRPPGAGRRAPPPDWPAPALGGSRAICCGQWDSPQSREPRRWSGGAAFGSKREASGDCR